MDYCRITMLGSISDTRPVFRKPGRWAVLFSPVLQRSPTLRSFFVPPNPKTEAVRV